MLKLRFSIFISIFVLLAMAAGCSNNSYLTKRGRDALDIVTVGVGVGLGGKARVGPLQVGLLADIPRIGLRGGEFRDAQGPGKGWFPPLSYDLQWVIKGSETFNGAKHDRRKNFRAFAKVPFFHRAVPSRASPYYFTHIEIAADLLLGVRLGFNPGELVDFLLGWGGVDLFKDDVAVQDAATVQTQAEEEHDFWTHFFDQNERGYSVDELKARLSRPGREIIAKRLSTHQNLTSESLHRLFDLFKEKENFYQQIAQNPHADRELIQELLSLPGSDGVPRYAVEVAMNPSIPEDLLVELSQSPSLMVRHSVVRNRNTPTEILEDLAHNTEISEATVEWIRKKTRLDPSGESMMDYYLERAEVFIKDIQKGARESLDKRALDDKAEDLTIRALQAVKNNKLKEAHRYLEEAEKGAAHASSTRIVYLGWVSCMLGDYEMARTFYEDGLNILNYSGRYKKDQVRQYISLLLLTGREAEAEDLLEKFTSWYPDDEEILKFAGSYDALKRELLKFAVSDQYQPEKAPRSLERLQSFNIF